MCYTLLNSICIESTGNLQFSLHTFKNLFPFYCKLTINDTIVEPGMRNRRISCKLFLSFIAYFSFCATKWIHELAAAAHQLKQPSELPPCSKLLECVRLWLSTYQLRSCWTSLTVGKGQRVDPAGSDGWLLVWDITLLSTTPGRVSSCRTWRLSGRPFCATSTLLEDFSRVYRNTTFVA